MPLLEVSSATVNATLSKIKNIMLNNVNCFNLWTYSTLLFLFLSSAITSRICFLPDKNYLRSFTWLTVLPGHFV